jgi:hypothetical protein
VESFHLHTVISRLVAHIPQESAEGAAATGSVSNLTKALKETFG